MLALSSSQIDNAPKAIPEDAIDGKIALKSVIPALADGCGVSRNLPGKAWQRDDFLIEIERYKCGVCT
ncbi:hypothetical protein [Rhizobium sp. BE258]|uniref:hypothetical protein n=1 Tax=Rhizobium sp. BE258 TaxID=2817722 RepID=UPI0028611EEC|nr:hypothetical protein [Rhizobium sp. BE258]MDR7144772.1 hypothetical protein [Rhizobium sp. BE258]